MCKYFVGSSEFLNSLELCSTQPSGGGCSLKRVEAYSDLASIALVNRGLFAGQDEWRGTRTVRSGKSEQGPFYWIHAEAIDRDDNIQR